SLKLNPSGRGMIVHTFSNGGGLQLLILSELLESRLKDIDASLQGLQYLRIPIALIFDSLPGCLQRTGNSEIFSDTPTPRLYAYSDTDEVVAHESVEEHLEGIRTILNVRAERFTGSRHVSHAKKDPKRYWSAVEGLWNEALHEAKVSLVPRVVYCQFLLA
ncbi:hypothetical protein MPER_03326, partial [Moniliophthora perniciosa FA553]